MSSKQTLSKLSSSEQPTEMNCSSQMFIKLFEADKNRLYAYIYAYMMDKTAADDIFQETSMVLWRNIEKFQPGTSFSKWANGIAFNRVREYRYAHKKYVLGFNDDFLQEFSEDISINDTKQSKKQERKWGYLEQCCTQLPAPLQNIYQSFYVKNIKAQQLADETGRSIYAIRKAIRKLRQKLYDCVEDKLREGSQ